MTQVIYSSLIFYISFIVMLGLLGVSTESQTNLVEFPPFPDIPNISETNPIFFLASLVINFVLWIGLIIAFLFNLITFGGFGLLPLWLSTILFLPLTVIIIYEVVARQIRGS